MPEETRREEEAKPDKAFPNSDFLFLWEVRYSNPNGDPDDEGKPRQDPKTKAYLATAESLKARVRSLAASYGHPVWVDRERVAGKQPGELLKEWILALLEEIAGRRQKEGEENPEAQKRQRVLQRVKGKAESYLAKGLGQGDPKEGAKKALEALKPLFEEPKAEKGDKGAKAKGSSKDSDSKAREEQRTRMGHILGLGRILLEGFTDNRLFGYLVPIKGEENKTGDSLRAVGPVQMNLSYGLINGETLALRVSTVFEGREKGRTSLGRKWVVSHAVMATLGRMSERNAAQTGATYGDAEVLRRLLIHGVGQTNTGSRNNQTPLLYLEVEWKGPHAYLGDLRELVEVKKGDGGWIEVDLGRLMVLLGKDHIRSRVKRILFWARERVRVRWGEEEKEESASSGEPTPPKASTPADEPVPLWVKEAFDEVVPIDDAELPCP